MALYCSRDIFSALNGISFPAKRSELLTFATQKDAPEAVLVVLNGLDEDAIFEDISEVCENARISCNIEIARALSGATFPATREELLDFSSKEGVSETTIQALKALPSGYTFEGLDEMCEYIL